MDAINFAEKTIAIIEEIRKLDEDKDVLNRIIVSRLYYAAHHAARQLLELRGHDPGSWRGSVHQRVIDGMKREFVNSSEIPAKALARLRDMRSKRVKANYNLTIPLQEPEVDKVVRLCKHFIQECKQLRSKLDESP